jgi:hypothetical protein
MAQHDPNPWQHRAAPEAVAASTGASSWTVAVDERAALPAEVAAMVAPSIVVCAAPRSAPAPAVAAAQHVVAPARPRGEMMLYRMNMASPPPPGGRHRRRARAS